MNWKKTTININSLRRKLCLTKITIEKFLFSTELKTKNIPLKLPERISQITLNH